MVNLQITEKHISGQIKILRKKTMETENSFQNIITSYIFF